MRGIVKVGWVYLSIKVIFNTVDARDLITATSLRVLLFDVEEGTLTQWIE